jgi:hypothetical protein
MPHDLFDTLAFYNSVVTILYVGGATVAYGAALFYLFNR